MPDRETGTQVPRPGTSDPIPGRLRATPILDALLGRAVTIPSTAVRAHVDSVRRRNPGATPAQVLDLLEREYLAVVATTGGAVGAAAAIPAVGTGAALLLTGSDVATFFGASAAFSLAVADVHGIAVDDVERRRALLLASVLGEKAARDVEKAAGGSTIAWGKLLVTKMPQGTLKQVNRALSSRFLRTQLVKQGGLAMGRIVPFGVGAVVGFAGGRALGHGVIEQSRSAFGAPPERFPRILEVVEGGSDLDAPTLEQMAAESAETTAPRRRLLGRKKA